MNFGEGKLNLVSRQRITIYQFMAVLLTSCDAFDPHWLYSYTPCYLILLTTFKNCPLWSVSSFFSLRFISLLIWRKSTKLRGKKEKGKNYVADPGARIALWFIFMRHKNCSLGNSKRSGVYNHARFASQVHHLFEFGLSIDFLTLAILFHSFISFYFVSFQ